MMLKALILAEHSKAQKDLIIEWVGSNEKRFDELFRLLLDDEYRVIQRAAWPIAEICITHPSWLKKVWPQLLERMKDSAAHVAVRRNGLKIFREADIPLEAEGDLMNLCFDYLMKPDEAIAVKAFSAHILMKLMHTYPEISNELELILEQQLEKDSPAIISVRKKFQRQKQKKETS